MKVLVLSLLMMLSATIQVHAELNVEIPKECDQLTGERTAVYSVPGLFYGKDDYLFTLSLKDNEIRGSINNQGNDLNRMPTSIFEVNTKNYSVEWKMTNNETFVYENCIAVTENCLGDLNLILLKLNKLELSLDSGTDANTKLAFQCAYAKVADMTLRLRRELLPNGH